MSPGINHLKITPPFDRVFPLVQFHGSNSPTLFVLQYSVLETLDSSISNYYCGCILAGSTSSPFLLFAHSICTYVDSCWDICRYQPHTEEAVSLASCQYRLRPCIIYSMSDWFQLPGSLHLHVFYPCNVVTAPALFHLTRSGCWEPRKGTSNYPRCDAIMGSGGWRAGIQNKHHFTRNLASFISSGVIHWSGPYPRLLYINLRSIDIGATVGAYQSFTILRSTEWLSGQYSVHVCRLPGHVSLGTSYTAYLYRRHRPISFNRKWSLYIRGEMLQMLSKLA